MADTDTPKVRHLKYITGFRKGVLLEAFTEPEQADPDFVDGWTAGREAKRRASVEAGDRFGYDFTKDMLRIQ